MPRGETYAFQDASPERLARALLRARSGPQPNADVERPAADPESDSELRDQPSGLQPEAAGPDAPDERISTEE